MSSSGDEERRAYLFRQGGEHYRALYESNSEEEAAAAWRKIRETEERKAREEKALSDRGLLWTWDDVEFERIVEEGFLSETGVERCRVVRSAPGETAIEKIRARTREEDRLWKLEKAANDKHADNKCVDKVIMMYRESPPEKFDEALKNRKLMRAIERQQIKQISSMLPSPSDGFSLNLRGLVRLAERDPAALKAVLDALSPDKAERVRAALAEAKRANKGHGLDFDRLSDDEAAGNAELTRTKTIKLNRVLREMGCSKETIESVKTARRTLLNRGYARKSRSRGIGRLEELRADVASLKRHRDLVLAEIEDLHRDFMEEVTYSYPRRLQALAVESESINRDDWAVANVVDGCRVAKGNDEEEAAERACLEFVTGLLPPNCPLTAHDVIHLNSTEVLRRLDPFNPSREDISAIWRARLSGMRELEIALASIRHREARRRVAKFDAVWNDLVATSEEPTDVDDQQQRVSYPDLEQMLPPNCPLSIQDVVSMDKKKFSEIVSRGSLTEQEVRQLRAVRRKGKNRKAAKKSREETVTSVRQLAMKKAALKAEIARLQAIRSAFAGAVRHRRPQIEAPPRKNLRFRALHPEQESQFDEPQKINRQKENFDRSEHGGLKEQCWNCGAPRQPTNSVTVEIANRKRAADNLADLRAKIARMEVEAGGTEDSGTGDGCLPKAGKTVAKVAKKTLRKLRPLHQQRR